MTRIALAIVRGALAAPRCAWARWRLSHANQAILEAQAMPRVGSAYLCNVMRHRDELQWRIASLSNPTFSRSLS